MADISVLYDSGGSDIIAIAHYINSITKGLGIQQVQIDPDILYRIDQIMRQDFPHNDGLEKSSPFKKVANFSCFFTSEKPILHPFPKEIIGEHIAKINNHQNAIVAYLMSIDSLEGATLNRSDGEKIVLKNRIKISKHSLCDIVFCLANTSPIVGFNFMSVLYEQLAYRANPDASYPLVI